MSPAPTDTQAITRKPRKAGVVVPHSPRWYQRLGAWLIVLFGRSVALTLRFRTSAKFAGSPPAAGPVIFCFWHNRLALTPMLGGWLVSKKWPGANVAALVSASKDGAFLSAIIQALGLQPVRGSSSRRGAQALLELTSWAERGYSLAITPDGPRGPKYKVQEGAILLAQVTGLPIVPFSYSISSKVVTRSWDGFQIPLPFSRCEMAFGELLRVPHNATDDERAEARQELERRLVQITAD